MTKLTMFERDVWYSIARAISSTGLSPSYRETGDDINRDHTRISQVVTKLERYGYIRKTGNRNALTLHVLKWPDHIPPRETEGRTGDGPVVRASKEPIQLGHMPGFPRSESSCATEGCRLTRQPGRSHCAACLSHHMPVNRRAHMSDVFEGECYA